MYLRLTITYEKGGQTEYSHTNEGNPLWRKKRKTRQIVLYIFQTVQRGFYHILGNRHLMKTLQDFEKNMHYHEN